MTENLENIVSLSQIPPRYTIPMVPLIFGKAVTLTMKIECLIKKLNEIVDAYNSIENTWDADIKAAIEANNIVIRQEIETAKQQALDAVDSLKQYVDQLESENQQEFSDIAVEFTLVWAEFAKIRTEMQKQFVDLVNLMDAKDNALWVKIEKRLDDFLEEVSDLIENGFLIENPFSGFNRQTVGKTISDFYQAFVGQDNGLTASQYEKLGITATQYDIRFVPAAGYDFDGYRSLIDSNALVESQFQTAFFFGHMDTVHHKLMNLVALHTSGSSAQDYDALDLSAEDVEAKQISAYEWDWKGVS